MRIDVVTSGSEAIPVKSTTGGVVVPYKKEKI